MLAFLSRHGDSRYIAMLGIDRPAPDGCEDVAQLGAIMWPDKRQVTARVQPGDDGKLWRFFHTGALAGASRADASLWLRTPEVPLVVADQRERFFVPQRPPLLRSCAPDEGLLYP